MLASKIVICMNLYTYFICWCKLEELYRLGCLCLKKLLAVVIASSLLCVSPVFAEADLNQVGASTAKPSATPTSATIKNNIFSLSDQQMKNAIKIGADGLQSISKFQASQRLPIVEDKIKRLQPNVNLITPYYYISMRSYSASSNYEQFTLADAKKAKKLFSSIDELGFSLRAFGDRIDFANNINVVFKQGSVVLQPRLSGNDEYASASGSNYTLAFMAYFDINKIDFSKPAELIYLYAGKELSVTYKVDFSKIK